MLKYMESDGQKKFNELLNTVIHKYKIAKECNMNK